MGRASHSHRKIIFCTFIIYMLLHFSMLPLNPTILHNAKVVKPRPYERNWHDRFSFPPKRNWHEDDRLGHVNRYVLLMLPLCFVAHYLAMSDSGTRAVGSTRISIQDLRFSFILLTIFFFKRTTHQYVLTLGPLHLTFF